MVEPVQEVGREPLAMVGIGCRFPGGIETPEAFWDFLAGGRHGFSDVPADRWSLERFGDPENARPGMAMIRQGAFLSQDPASFDAEFFGISGREANCLDPQQRWLLEVAWEAFEDAGLVPETLSRRRTGVYVGGFTFDAMLMQLSEANRDLIGSHTATSGTLGMLANRLSYAFDLHGPSLTIDTACSSSLVALHYGAQDLWSNRCDIALVGGVNSMLKPEFPITMSKGGFLSADGRSKAFDHRANGYARGEGAAIVVLKRLSSAVADGDRVYALVRGTGVNQDGRTHGITVPNGEAQKTLIEEVLREAAVDPENLVYAEAHGTGTPVGDPIEASALGRAIARRRSEPLVVGSVKANIGHLEAAAGVAGVIKAALCLNHRAVPPQLHIEKPNPKIAFGDLNLLLPMTETPLPDRSGICASINSFGFGGTNAHVVIEAGETARRELPSATAEPGGRPIVLPVSGRSDAALKALASACAQQLKVAPPRLSDLVYTMGCRRAHHAVRAAVVVSDTENAIKALEDVAAGRATPIARSGTVAEPTAGPLFVMTGMGPQWWGMGRTLLRKESAYREAVEEADQAFAKHAGWSVLAEMAKEESESRITENWLAQPANFVLQVGLVALWRSWGIRPAAIIGHSVGEVSAAWAAGCLSLRDATLVSFHRSRIQQRAAGRGAMLALGLEEPEAVALMKQVRCGGDIAAANSPRSVVVAGERSELEKLVPALGSRFHRFLKVEVPYHSAIMDPLRGEVLASLAEVEASPPRIPLYSTVTGGRVRKAIHNAAYWWQNVRQTVRFGDGLAAAVADGHRLFLEVGPHPVLAAAIKEIGGAKEEKVVSLRSLSREDDELLTLHDSVAALYCAGVVPDFAALNGPGRFVSGPRYPWQRRRHWVESDRSVHDRCGVAGHPLLGLARAGPDSSWEAALTPGQTGYLTDHVVQGSAVFPGAGYIEIGLAASAAAGLSGAVVDNIRFHEALILPDGEMATLHTVLAERTLTIHGRNSGSASAWQRLASMVISGRSPTMTRSALDLAHIRAGLLEECDGPALYRRLRERGLEYGPRFQGIRRLWRGDGAVLAEISRPDGSTGFPSEKLDPAVLDCCFQSLIAAVPDQAGAVDTGLYVPVAVGRVVVAGRLTDPIFCWGRLSERGRDSLYGDLSLVDINGRVLAEISDLECKRIGSSGSRQPGAGDAYYAYRFEPLERPEPVSRGRATLLVGDKRSTSFARGEAVDANPVRLREALRRLNRPANLVFLPALDPERDPAGVTGVADLLALLQVAINLLEEGSRILVVVRGLHAIGDRVATGSPGLAAFWGLARSVMSEHPQFDCIALDLPESDEAALAALDCELNAGARHDEIAWRDGQRFGNRLRHVTLPAATAEVVTATDRDAYSLEFAQAGSVDSLHYVEAERVAPGPGCVELKFEHVSLNFKDVLKVLGVLSDDVLRRTFFRRSLGMEGTARVVRVGPDVDALAPGQQVVVTAPSGCFRTYATIPVAEAHALPAIDGLDPAALAGVPIAMVTAYYGLHEVGRLQPGETVLLHSATGGVGLAAIQVARWLGAKIIATAGTDTKRAYLRGLGIAHVFDSRSLSFADEVRAVTAGEGVDVVLNFLQDEALDLSLSLLRSFGRMIEIGKRDISQDRGLLLGKFNDSITFAAIDIDRMLADRPKLFDRVFKSVWDLLEKGTLKPLPTTVISASRIADAMRMMMKTEHIGKIVVTFAGETVDMRRAKPRSQLFKPDASYLVTGGLGGFGGAVAEWMVACGARHLVLVGRSGASTPAANALVTRLQAQGATVLPMAVDVGDWSGVTGLLDHIRAELPPLRGIFHSAAVLRDGLLLNTDRAAMQAVMGPKAQGAWNLHRASLGMQLDHFVLFSSVSSIVGNAGQANYVAANGVLDALAQIRRSAGLPAVSVNWGAIADVGMAARDAGTLAHLERIGLTAMKPREALSGLARHLERSGAADAPPNIGLFQVDWRRLAEANRALSESERFAGVLEHEVGDDGRGRIIALLADATPAMRLDIVAELLAEDFAEVLRTDPENLSVDRAFAEMGIDSLMTIELQMKVEMRFSVKIPVLELSSHMTFRRLASAILANLLGGEEGAEPVPDDVDVEAMSDAEVEAMLATLREEAKVD